MAGGVNLPQGYFTVKEVAKQTGYSVAQLRRLDNLGRVRAFRIQCGGSNYRAYTQKQIEEIKALRLNSQKRRLNMLQHQLKDLIGEIKGWDTEYSSVKLMIYGDPKKAILTIAYDDDETKDIVKDLFMGKLKLLDPEG